jgi:cation:H+ antiporter
MIIDLFFFAIGLLMLYLGAELLVRGASLLALLARISPLIVGVTIVAFGTSSPEFLVSIVAGWTGRTGVALGNIIGSNIANIGLIIGISILLRPLELRDTYIKREVFWMLGASAIFWLSAADGTLSTWEGILMLTAIIVFSAVLARQSMRERKESSPADMDIPAEPGWIKKFSKKWKVIIYLIHIAVGIVILIWGSEITVDAAIDLARFFGVPELIIGLTLVAFGTSLPELATALVSIVRRENEILIGNIIGSNIFNLLFVGGALAAGFYVPVSGEIYRLHIPVMVIFSLMILPAIYGKKILTRYWGLVILLMYFLFILLIYIY